MKLPVAQRSRSPDPDSSLGVLAARRWGGLILSENSTMFSVATSGIIALIGAMARGSVLNPSESITDSRKELFSYKLYKVI
ncbi:MAG: hypothetical protein HC889_12915 [Synechococcaceae cyanobacterium SM1_2_3]|nr:hypothetical protein [Synechococcaceae cyanobacterium SM1_2_3]